MLEPSDLRVDDLLERTRARFGLVAEEESFFPVGNDSQPQGLVSAAEAFINRGESFNLRPQAGSFRNDWSVKMNTNKPRFS
jgi:hypothetical protein